MSEDSVKPAIGFIGVGWMGHGMAANILRGGYPLQVKGNRNRQPVEDLVAQGATEAESPRAMAEGCEVVHLCLSNSPQVEAVIRGPDGILASAREGLIVIDATTADPTSTAALAAELEAAGMTMVDAPLGRTPKEAEAGTLDAIVGASPEAFERVRPVIECWAGSINHVGPTGSGHRMKLIMNFVSLGYAALYSEALAMGVRSGLSPQSVRDVLGGSRMANPFFETFMSGAVGRDPRRASLLDRERRQGHALRRRDGLRRGRGQLPGRAHRACLRDGRGGGQGCGHRAHDRGLRGGARRVRSRRGRQDGGMRC